MNASPLGTAAVVSFRVTSPTTAFAATIGPERVVYDVQTLDGERLDFVVHDHGLEVLLDEVSVADQIDLKVVCEHNNGVSTPCRL